MRWRRLGRVFCPQGNAPWLHSHAALPVAVPLGDDVVRFFFSSRDAERRSHVAWVDVDLRSPTQVIRVADRPVLAPGAPGTFDDSGIGIGCVVRANGLDRLYYMGWNLGVVAPWRNAIGLAEGDARLPGFERFSIGPILDRNPHDPFTLSYPWVARADEGWRIWYGSSLSWGTDKTDMRHVIKYATSADGIEWHRDGTTAIDLIDGEDALSRPCVLRDGDCWRMWYARRSGEYRIGYAESVDGVAWTRRDAAMGFDVAAEGWDSQALCYPCVFDHKGRRYLAYNGNGYGASGFGLAVLEDE